MRSIRIEELYSRQLRDASSDRDPGMEKQARIQRWCKLVGKTTDLTNFRRAVLELESSWLRGGIALLSAPAWLPEAEAAPLAPLDAIL